MKKALAIVLTLVMVLTLSVTALADDVWNYDDTAANGSIVIKNAVEGSTYTAYRLFILDSYSTDGKHAYSVPDGMVNFVKGATTWLTFDENDNWVTWKTDKEAATMQAFANAAKAYIDDNEPEIEEATGLYEDGVVTFSNLKLGYWLVVSTTGEGAVLVLDTTNPEGVMYEKNAQPTLDKVVQEDSKTGDDAWGKTNTADIGDTINFKVTIQAVGHVENYVLHDTMSAGLTFNADSVALTWNGTSVANTKYTVKTNLGDGCTFEIDLDETFEQELNANNGVDTLIFTYTAKLNKDAVINGDNTNTADLTYTNEYGIPGVPDVDPVTTVTKTYDFTIDKFGINVDTGATQTKLQGVEFELYADSNLSTKIGFTMDGTAYEYNSDVDATVFTLTTDAEGKFTVQGLDAATYWLKETKTNAGYNLLKNPIMIVVGEDGKITYTDVSNEKTDVTADDVISIENKSGVELPATGGMGTVLFILIGSLLVMATGVVLVTNKRMSKIAD